MASLSLSLAQSELQRLNTSARSSSGSNSHPYGNSSNSSTSRSLSKRGVDSDADKSFRFCCLKCGSRSPEHKQHLCNETKNGRGTDIILIQGAATGERERTDRHGNKYCFPFNSRRGCRNAADNCSNGKHWCTLCGAKEPAHSAQDCSIV
ncbi:hypothetical protein C8F01DRAFT_1138332 [Mycena amicta]|nr:hypothetical protein C8F01DRAFT_1138332 [Mycena amicta]